MASQKSTNPLVPIITFFILIMISFSSLKEVPLNRSHQTSNSYCLENSLPAQYNCPVKSGYYLLPRHHTPTSIFLGYSISEANKDIIRKIVDISLTFSPPLKVNIVAPVVGINGIRHSLLSIQDLLIKENVQILPLGSDDTLWVQDFMEIAYNISQETPILIDLPYHDRLSDWGPDSLSLTCKWPMIEQPASYSIEPDDGDYGGNIESLPGHWVAVGDNMTEDLQSLLKKHFRLQRFVKLPVSWLETGHVDEIISYHTKSNRECPLYISYASPKKAFELLESEKDWSGFLPSGRFDIFYDEEEPRTDFSSCFSGKTSDRNSKLCQELKKANSVYELLVKRAALDLQEKIRQSSKCPHIETIPIPQIFAPQKVAKQYGTSLDLARSINPNSVNNILLGRHLIISSQTHPKVQQYLSQQFKASGLKIHFVDSGYIHHLSGGIHCISLVSRTCKK